MASTTFCSGFFQEILTKYRDSVLKIVLLNESASSVIGSSLEFKSQINSYIVNGTEKIIENTIITDNTLNASIVSYTNMINPSRYAIVYDDTSLLDEAKRILFFINFETNQLGNFDVDWGPNGLMTLS